MLSILFYIRSFLLASIHLPNWAFLRIANETLFEFFLPINETLLDKFNNFKREWRKNDALHLIGIYVTPVSSCNLKKSDLLNCPIYILAFFAIFPLKPTLSENCDIFV